MYKIIVCSFFVLTSILHSIYPQRHTKDELLDEMYDLMLDDMHTGFTRAQSPADTVTKFAREIRFHRKLLYNSQDYIIDRVMHFTMQDFQIIHYGTQVMTKRNFIISITGELKAILNDIASVMDEAARLEQKNTVTNDDAEHMITLTIKFLEISSPLLELANKISKIDEALRNGAKE